MHWYTVTGNFYLLPWRNMGHGWGFVKALKLYLAQGSEGLIHFSLCLHREVGDWFILAFALPDSMGD